jgi:hypothetical protein
MAENDSKEILWNTNRVSTDQGRSRFIEASRRLGPTPGIRGGGNIPAGGLLNKHLQLILEDVLRETT